MDAISNSEIIALLIRLMGPGQKFEWQSWQLVTKLLCAFIFKLSGAFCNSSNLEPQCVLNQTSGKCDNINPANPRQGFAYYCPTYAGGDGVSIYSNNILDSGWISLNFTADASGTAVEFAEE